jgi:hypothetical protein
MGQAFSFGAAVAQPPTLAGSQTSLVAAAAPSAALSIADVIWVMKLFFLVAITVVPCVTYGVSLWRLIASRSSNSGNPMAASSAATESPGTKQTTVLTCFLLSLFCAGFCCASNLVVVVRIARAQPQLPLYWKPADFITSLSFYSYMMRIQQRLSYAKIPLVCKVCHP